jgi:hypothetical protein
MTPRLLTVFLYPKVDILLYPHQCYALMRRHTEWDKCLRGDAIQSLGTLSTLSGLARQDSTPVRAARVSLGTPIEVNTRTASRVSSSLDGPIWSPRDTQSEVALVFRSDDEVADDEYIISDQDDASGRTLLGPANDTWCADATRVHFEHGWYALFAADDTVNVVRGVDFDERYVRSLKVGDRVLLIHGQRRQSLYDLIISRVHRHPSIELHLALIRRWQEDLLVAFERWCQQRNSPDELRSYGTRDASGLLRRMQARGSHLTVPLTLYFWLKRSVLCPQDEEDLRRVAETLDMKFVQQHYKRISHAATRLRGIHRGLSRKLNDWLRAQAAGGEHNNDDDVIDGDLGLTFGDIRSSLQILPVVQIECLKGPFLRNNLGRIEKDA